MQDLMDKAFDEGQRDNKEFNETIIDKLREAGCFESFEGKEVHELNILPLGRKEALDAYLNSGGKTKLGMNIENGSFEWEIQEHKKLRVMTLKLPKNTPIERAKDEIIRLGFHPLDWQELTQYGTQHPSHQEQNKILISVGSKENTIGGNPNALHLDEPYPYYPALMTVDGVRRISVRHWGDSDGSLSGEGYRFLVVREEK